jgi:signal transduction histidine kinase
MTVKRDPSKLVQIGFIALLGVLIAQATYWIYDRVTLANSVRDDTAALFAADATAISVLLDDGTAADLDDLLPHLDIDAATGTARVRQAAVDDLEAEVAARTNQFLWEGGFFILVLLAGVTVLTRAIRHDAELRKRQQNFLGAVSHEFKSPLASIRLAAETLALRGGEAEGQRLGRRIIDDTDRLLRMIDNLLDTTRIEEGREQIEPARMSLIERTRAAVEAIAERARLAGVSIEHDVAADFVVEADRDALDTILRNLLENALSACAAGDGDRIAVTARHIDAGVELAVTDNGAGFPAEDAEMIFEKFYRAGDELTRTTPGTGLGLFIVRRLTEVSGAHITAASDGAGRGARFAIVWPGGNP